jgi:hypothetical protein
MIEPGSPEFPAAKDDDDDDVAWALSTALVQWKRGSQADAVVWFRRAIDSAVSVGATWRAAELTRQTDALEGLLLGARGSAPPSQPSRQASYPAPLPSPYPAAGSLPTPSPSAYPASQPSPSRYPAPGSYPAPPASPYPAPGSYPAPSPSHYPAPGSYPAPPASPYPAPGSYPAPSPSRFPVAGSYPAPPASPYPAPGSQPPSYRVPQSVSFGASESVDIDDYDGTDMIDADVLSLPPDAEVAPASAAGQHAYTADDDPTTVQADDADSEFVEIDEIEEDDEIADDELGEIDAMVGGPSRFASEAPTANLVVRPASEPETDIRHEIPRPSLAALRAMHASEPEEDPSPTPMRMSAVPESHPEPELPEPAPELPEPEPELPEPEPAPELPEPEPELPEPEPELPEPEPELPEPEPELPEPEPELPEPEPAPELPEPEPAPELPEPEPVPPPPPSVPSEPYVAGISLAEIRGFEDFPPETQLELARGALVERLATEEEVSGFGLALVLRGAVNVMPTIADVACGAAGERELVYGRGTLPDGVPLRLVATAPDTQIAVWSFDVIGAPLAACPWVLEELQALADRYQALAGVSMGPMGDRLDDSLRGMVLSRCRLVRLLPGEVLVEKGKPVGGLFIVGAGKLELGDDAKNAGSQGELLPGDFLFAQQVLTAGLAPTTARAGAAGALLMAADRHAAHELMLSVPPLLELLAG